MMFIIEHWEPGNIEQSGNYGGSGGSLAFLSKQELRPLCLVRGGR